MCWELSLFRQVAVTGTAHICPVWAGRGDGGLRKGLWVLLLQQSFYVPSVSEEGQKEAGFPSSQWPLSWVIQSFSPFPLSHRNTHNGRIKQRLVNILCANSFSGNKNTGLCKDTCSKSLWFRAVCVLHLHLPELAHPPRAQRNQFCSLGASSTHSWLHLALCCTKTRKGSQRSLWSVLALALLHRGAWAMRWLPTCRTGRMDWDICVSCGLRVLKVNTHLGPLEEGIRRSHASRPSTHMQTFSTEIRASVCLTGFRICSRTLENCYRAQEIEMDVWKIVCTVHYSNKELCTHTIG